MDHRLERREAITTVLKLTGLLHRHAVDIAYSVAHGTADGGVRTWIAQDPTGGWRQFTSKPVFDEQRRHWRYPTSTYRGVGIRTTPPLPNCTENEYNTSQWRDND